MLRTMAEDGELDGKVTISFHGESASFDANARLSGDEECASALRAMPNIGDVSCMRGNINEVGGAEYIISLLR